MVEEADRRTDGLALGECTPPGALATIIARRGRAAMAAARAEREFGVPLPSRPRAVAVSRAPSGLPFAMHLLWSGPGQWLAVADDPVDGLEMQTALEAVFVDTAVVVDQSGSRSRFRVAGPLARVALSRGVGIDLHPSRFGPDDVALTQVAHVGVQLWQRDSAPTMDLLVARSYAESFSEWLNVVCRGLR